MYTTQLTQCNCRLESSKTSKSVYLCRLSHVTHEQMNQASSKFFVASKLKPQRLF